MTPSVEVKNLLVSGGHGVFAAATGWSIFIDHEPAVQAGRVPETVIVVTDAAGFDPLPMVTGMIYHPGVQIRVRGAQNGEAAAKTKIEAVRDELIRLPRTSVTGATIIGVWLVGDVAYTGHDEERRPHYTVNFRMMWESA